MSKPQSNEMKALQKKFIPANIIICLIALVAGICMILMPWIDIRVHIEGEKLAAIMAELPESSADSSNIKPFDTSNEESVSQEDLIVRSLVEALKNFNCDIPINLYPTKMLSAATGNKEQIEEMFNSAIGKDGAEKFLDDFVQELAPVVVQASLNATIDQMFNELTEELTAEELAQVEEYKGLVSDALTNIAEDPSVENAKAQLHNIADQILADNQIEVSEEDVKIIRNIVDEVVAQGEKDGKFDYVHLIKNLDIEALEKAVSDAISSPDATPSKAEGSSTASGFNASFEGEGSSAEANPLTAIIEMLENPGSLVSENLTEEDVKMLNLAFLAITIVFVGFPAMLCFILALSALIRIFTKKKRVRFWYVKIILFISAITILSLNLLTHFVMPALVSSLGLGAQVQNVFNAFSITFLGSGVVNAICWVLLTIVSLFYYRRVKKQVRIQKQIDNNNLSAVIA